MLIEADITSAGPPPMPRLGNPAVPVLGARIRRAIAGLSTVDIDRLGDGALSRITDQARLRALTVDAGAVRWWAGAVECDGRPGIKIEATIDYAGDRGLLTVMPWSASEPAVTVEVTDTMLIVSACGAVDDPEELIGPVRDTIERIERNVAIQVQHVLQANAAAKPLAAILLRRRARRDAASRQGGSDDMPTSIA